MHTIKSCDVCLCWLALPLSENTTNPSVVEYFWGIFSRHSSKSFCTFACLFYQQLIPQKAQICIIVPGTDVAKGCVNTKAHIYAFQRTLGTYCSIQASHDVKKMVLAQTSWDKLGPRGFWAVAENFGQVFEGFTKTDF